MTRETTTLSPAISTKDFVLATDLDGTFLGGADADRARLYSWIEDNRDRVGLIFVTGRDPGFISALTRENGVPRPDYVVGDVGTTIAQVGDDHLLTPIASLEAEIAAAWGDSAAKVEAALHGTPGLTRQPTAFRYRVSYLIDQDSFDHSAITKIEALGFDVLISDNLYFDVLPKGISKGPSLLRLLAHLGVPHNRTLVAGDTLNDLSMLTLGLPSVAVGGSEPALTQKVAPLDHVFTADGIGTAGITQAISHHSLFPAQ